MGRRRDALDFVGKACRGIDARKVESDHGRFGRVPGMFQDVATRVPRGFGGGEVSVRLTQ